MGGVIETAQGVRQAKVFDRLKAGPGFRLGQGVLGEGGGVIDIVIPQNNIVIPAKNITFFQRQAGLDVGVEAINPRQLVGEFLSVDRISVRQINRGHPHISVHGAFHIARMLILIIAGQSAGHVLDGRFRQDRNPVVGLLSVGLDVIAKVLDFQAREALIDGFDFLQQHNIRRKVLEPAEDVGQAGFDGIHIPGGDLDHVYLSAFCGGAPVIA